jgi:hypothetical protein
MTNLKHAFAGFSLITYIFLTVFGLLAMEYLHQHSMNSMTNCPFMVGQQSLCTMNFTEHIASWQNLITSTVENLLILIVPLFFTSFFILLRPPNLTSSRLYEKPHREHPIASLFSRGILHPKAP